MTTASTKPGCLRTCLVSSVSMPDGCWLPAEKLRAAERLSLVVPIVTDSDTSLILIWLGRQVATQDVRRSAGLLRRTHEQEVTSVVTGIANVGILRGLRRVGDDYTLDLV